MLDDVIEVDGTGDDPHTLLRVLADAFESVRQAPPEARVFAMYFPISLDLPAAGALLRELMERDAAPLH